MAQYSDHIIKSPVVLFTGAGASAPLGYRTLNGLRDLVVDEVKGNQSWEQVLSKMGFLGGEDSPEALLSLEELLEKLEMLVDVKKFRKTYEGKWFTPTFEEEIETVLTLRTHILETIRDHFKDTANAEERVVALYDPLFKTILDICDTRVIPIFTTNYDLAIELFADARKPDFSIASGFEPLAAGNPRWNAQVYHSFSPPSYPHHETVTLALFKLHGSIFWYKKPGGKIVFNREPTIESAEIQDVVLYPMQTKTIVEDPYLSCYNYLEECLRKAKLMVVIGYSFGDKYINQVIQKCMFANPTLQMLVFNRGYKDRKREEQFRRLGFDPGRTKVSTSEFAAGESGRALLEEVRAEARPLVFEDDFLELPDGKGWSRNYWQPPNLKDDLKTCRIVDSCFRLAGTPEQLTHPRGNGAFKDLDVEMYQQYEVVCRVRSDPGTTCRFQLWLHDISEGGKEPSAREPDPPRTLSTEFEDIDLTYQTTGTGKLRIHLHYLAGDGVIFVDSVKVYHVQKIR